MAPKSVAAPARGRAPRQKAHTSSTLPEEPPLIVQDTDKAKAKALPRTTKRTRSKKGTTASQPSQPVTEGTSATTPAKTLPDIYQPSKRIHVFRNGDKHHPGRRFVVHRTLEFECLLDKLTHVLSPAKGFCRMYTPRGGTRVKTTQELESGKQYVAAANERFKPLDYGGIQDPVKQQLQNRHRSKTGVQLPKIKPRAVRSGRAKRLANYGTKTVWVLRNGDIKSKPLKLVLTRRNALTWEQVLQQFSDRLSPDGGSARKLYTFEGVRLKKLEEIQDHGRYVVVGLGTFKKLDYTVHEDKSIPRPTQSPVEKNTSQGQVATEIIKTTEVTLPQPEPTMVL